MQKVCEECGSDNYCKSCSTCHDCLNEHLDKQEQQLAKAKAEIAELKSVMSVNQWSVKPLHIIEYENYTFKYDSAEDLGRMVKESGCKMPNPFEPDFTEHDDFNEGYWNAKYDGDDNETN